MVRGIRGVGVVCEMWMCLARDGVRGEGDEWMRGLGLGLGLPILWKQAECWTCVCVLVAGVNYNCYGHKITPPRCNDLLK